MERKIDEKKIEKEAKQILEKFAKALEKVGKEHDLNFYVERDNFDREEIIGSESENSEKSKFANKSECFDPDFKRRMLENAPNHDEDFIIAEKGSWK